MKGSLLGVGCIAIILILSTAVIIYATAKRPYEDYVATREGELVSFGNFNSFFLETFNQSVEFISQRAAYELAKNGGFNEGEEVFWNFYYPQISDLRGNLERAIERSLPSYYKKLNRTVRLSNAKISVNEQNQYFDVTGGANFSITDDSIRAQTFSQQTINSHVYSSYFRLLKAAREILENQTLNSSLGDAPALLAMLRAETLPGGRFYGLDFEITVSGDILNFNITDICYPPNTPNNYCLAPLYSDEPKILKSGSDFIPYDYVRLYFRIKAKQTGATPPACVYLLDLNPKIGSMASYDEKNPGPTITVTDTGTTNDPVGLTAKIYDAAGNLVGPGAGITIDFADNGKPMPYSTWMIINTSNTPTGFYRINVTADGCSPNVERFAIYNLTVNPTMTFSIKVIPNNVKLISIPGYDNITNVIVNITGGTAKPVNLYFDSLPQGISYSLDTNNAPPNFSSVLSLATDGTTPGMVYPVTIKGFGGGFYNETIFNLIVDEPFDFDMFSIPNNAIIWRNSGFSPILTVENKTTGIPESVQIKYDIVSTTSHLPSPDDYNITISPSSYSCTPNPVCNPPMFISTTKYTPADTYAIHINASTTHVRRQMTFDLTVKWGCGDGQVPPQQCDGANLGGSDQCKDRFSYPPGIGGHQVTGGTLTCNSSCLFNTSACEYCGNNRKDPGEECDGTDNASCPVLGCKADCTCSHVMFSCQTVTGGCYGTGGNNWNKSTNARDALCDSGLDIAAVQCQAGYYVIDGGCRSNGGGTRITFSCPTNNPTSYDIVIPPPPHIDESKSCEDIGNSATDPGNYTWWFCDWEGSPNYETAYAVCCKTGVQ